MPEVFDVIVVGGGPAGLSCALVLGRCRRKVLVLDSGRQRNRASAEMHAFPSRDGEHPKVFLNTVKKELRDYGIRVRKKEVVSAKTLKSGFEIRTSSSEIFQSRKLLLATGLTDRLPPLKGAERYYGNGLFHCPYCDGWERRDKRWLVYARGKKAAVEVCLRSKTWTEKVALLAAYVSKLSARDRALLKKNGIEVIDAEVRELLGRHGRLKTALLADGARVACDALIFSAPPEQHSDLAVQLGCRMTKKGSIEFNRLQQTNVPGLFTAGDMARDMNLMVIAAAEGAKAAVVINTELNKSTRRK